MKFCNSCNISKDILDFKKDKRRPEGFTNTCKECMKIKGLEYYYRTKNKRSESIRENRKRSYLKNKDTENIRSSDYKLNNSEKIKEYNKEYYYTNKEKFKVLNKNYRINNYEKIKEYQREYINERLKNDIVFKISHYYRNMIRKSLKRKGYSKNSKTSQILKCSFDEFKLYLESKFEDWMSWNNYGKYNGELNYGWDIDHIIPVSSAETEEDLIKLNHYTNLQPLCSKINRDIKRDYIQDSISI
jgi:hypothetical protein